MHRGRSGPPRWPEDLLYCVCSLSQPRELSRLVCEAVYRGHLGRSTGFCGNGRPQAETWPVHAAGPAAGLLTSLSGIVTLYCPHVFTFMCVLLRDRSSRSHVYAGNEGEPSWFQAQPWTLPGRPSPPAPRALLLRPAPGGHTVPDSWRRLPFPAGNPAPGRALT